MAIELLSRGIQVPPPSRSLGRRFQQEPDKPASGRPAYSDRSQTTCSSDHKSRRWRQLPLSPHPQPSFHRGRQQAAQQTEATLANVPNSFPPIVVPHTAEVHSPAAVTLIGRAQPASQPNWDLSSGNKEGGRLMSVCALPPRQPRANDCHHHTVLGGVKERRKRGMMRRR